MTTNFSNLNQHNLVLQRKRISLLLFAISVSVSVFIIATPLVYVLDVNHEHAVFVQTCCSHRHAGVDLLRIRMLWQCVNLR